MRYPEGLGPVHFKITAPASTASASSGGSGGTPSGAAGGDLGSPGYPGPTVVGIQGTPVCTTAPATGDVLTFNGTEWCPASSSPSTNFLTTTKGEQGGLVTVSAAGAAYTIDCSLANTFDLTLTANLTLSISNPAPTGVDSHIVVVLRQGGSGSYTVTWPASVKWQSATGTNTGSAPTLWTAVGAQDSVELSTEDGGTTWGGYLTPHPVSGLTSPLTTKGDVWGWDSTNARVPVGADGQVLTADSTASLGVSYQTPSAIGPQHVHIDNVTFSGDGSTTIFYLPAAPVDAYSIGVYVAGSRSQDWALSGGILDVLTFGSAPASGTDNIVIDIAAAA